MKERGLIIENGLTVTVVELNYFRYYKINKDYSHNL